MRQSEDDLYDEFRQREMDNLMEKAMPNEYEVIFDVRVNKRLTDGDKDRLREAMLKALDDTPLPFNAGVVTAAVLEL